MEKVEGMIGESCELFKKIIQPGTILKLDMGGVSFFNSIGVKHWILWMDKFPTNCKVELHNCPLMVVNQASTVVGFLGPMVLIESFYAPMLCNKCEKDFVRLLKRGIHYDYKTNQSESYFKDSEKVECPVCKADSSLDFRKEKALKFLEEPRRLFV